MSSWYWIRALIIIWDKNILTSVLYQDNILGMSLRSASSWLQVPPCRQNIWPQCNKHQQVEIWWNDEFVSKCHGSPLHQINILWIGQKMMTIGRYIWVLFKMKKRSLQNRMTQKQSVDANENLRPHGISVCAKFVRKTRGAFCYMLQYRCWGTKVLVCKTIE